MFLFWSKIHQQKIVRDAVDFVAQIYKLGLGSRCKAIKEQEFKVARVQKKVCAAGVKSCCMNLGHRMPRQCTPAGLRMGSKTTSYACKQSVRQRSVKEI